MSESMTRRRLPPWLKTKLPGGEDYTRLKATMHGLNLHSVCEEAKCPNLGECWSRGVATFMILGDVCTRGCQYCAVSKGKPVTLDRDEPRRVGEAAARMNLRHVVVTSVDRDDQQDGGAAIFAETIHEIRRARPGTVVEVLIPDFRGNESALKTVLDAKPDILNHNVETVPRLYRDARKGGRYEWALWVLERTHALDPTMITKTGMMFGLGETDEEIRAVLRDLVARDVNLLTLGQYLRPTPEHLEVAKFYTPDEFAAWKVEAEALGFDHVESGPLVRSSYHADHQFEVAGLIKEKP
ncbi:MAG: lipoyl synthase [Planctomycetes bacterium]|nr:lipoyl synthase [Planctomycetota bacterium]